MVIVVLLVIVSIVFFFVYQANKPAPVEEDIDSNNKVSVEFDNGSEDDVVKLQMFCYKVKGNYFNVWPNIKGTCDYIDFRIAGVNFRKGINKHLGEFVGRLVPEPNNPHDPNAIRVEAPDGTRIGYVPKGYTSEVHSYYSLPFPCYCFVALVGDHYVGHGFITHRQMFTHNNTANNSETSVNTAVSSQLHRAPNGSLLRRWCKGVKTRAPPVFLGISAVFRA